MPSDFSKYTTVPEQYNGMPVAVIGAGAAGLATGYELMKLGFKPHFYEMQTQDAPNKKSYARPNGRLYSWDYGGNGVTSGAAAGWYPNNDTLTNDMVTPSYDRNMHSYGRRVVELGGMRFPATHLTLRSYVDSIFFYDYYYGQSGLKKPWVPFRDPGLYRTQNEPIL